MGDSLRELRRLPDDVKQDIGIALMMVQYGETPRNAKPLTGHKEFRGGSVMEIVERYSTDTYRAVYAAKIGDAIYVLHVFQKKSTSGIATPQRDIDLIIDRLRDARADAAKHQRG
jgi:phage-related protein